MNAWLLALRGMRHYWRTHLGVLLGIACATTVLCGALSVGDSVRLSLRDQSLARIGEATSVLAAGDRFVQADLSERIAAAVTARAGSKARCVPVMQLPGVAASDGGTTRTGIVDVFGVDHAFFSLSARGQSRQALEAGEAILNERLAAQLGVSLGDEIVVRVERPSLMPQEATMATVDEVSFALRVAGRAQREAAGEVAAASSAPQVELAAAMKSYVMAQQAAMDKDTKKGTLSFDISARHEDESASLIESNSLPYAFTVAT